MHQADVDRLKGEHEKNMKNLAQEFQDMVYTVFVLLCLFSTIQYYLRCPVSLMMMHFVNYISHLSSLLLYLFIGHALHLCFFTEDFLR